MIGAIILYVVGTWVINKIAALLRNLFSKRHFDKSLQTFLISVLKATLLLLLFLAIVGMLGVPITGFAALLAGAGLAIGAALNGSLGNLAGGVMIMIFKPFKVGEVIEAQGHTGKVLEIGIFNTSILSGENKVVILPNGGLSTGVISNYNTHGNLRVDILLTVAGSQDIETARRIALETVSKNPLVLEDPAPEVKVLKIDGNGLQLGIRPYTTQENYWKVYFAEIENIKNAFDANGVQWPVPTQISINKSA
ncbi:mechanosensitive ion channel protein [Niabella soli DSM 19437]|uniref:Mechanosensitive ion channel protein n=1 Tax=Niabella soli DSM 19437 TaxID=929713 RepID=W0EU91_9BACT|nr:mechanosensitive ion channel protein [Niabella soli DSM 19437]